MDENKRLIDLGDQNMWMAGILSTLMGLPMTVMFLMALFAGRFNSSVLIFGAMALGFLGLGIYSYGFLYTHTLTVDLEGKCLIEKNLFGSKRFNFSNISKVALEKQCTLMTNEWTGCLRINVYDYSNNHLISMYPIWQPDFALFVFASLIDGTELYFEDKVGLTEPV